MSETKSDDRPRRSHTVLAILITTLLGTLGAIADVLLLERYGWGLFVALPLTMGAVAVLLRGIARPIGCAAALLTAMCSVSAIGAMLFMLGLEGLICLIMAAPLWLALGLLGGLIGYGIHVAVRTSSGTIVSIAALALLAPGLMGAETLAGPEPPVYAVRTAVVVDAPPEVVWRMVVTFDELPEPREWLFRTGIAYPQRAVIRGRGVGAVRYCVFSTGAFVEPIEVWDEPRLLRFSVTDNPAPMEEWSLFSHVHPPHLRGFLESRAGQFRLVPLDDGRTLLEGTTWYQHGLWPATYWRLLSDRIIHRIHLRVLDHCRGLAEQQVAAGAAA